MDQARVEAALITEFASMAVQMAEEEEYAGLKRVLTSLQAHVIKLNNVLAPEQASTEKKPAKK